MHSSNVRPLSSHCRVPSLRSAQRQKTDAPDVQVGFASAVPFALPLVEPEVLGGGSEVAVRDEPLL